MQIVGAAAGGGSLKTARHSRTLCAQPWTSLPNCIRQACPMHVQYYSPPQNHPLREIVATVWQVQHDSEHSVETILPKNRLDILFNLEEPQRVRSGEYACHLKPNHIYLSGMQTRACHVQPSGRTTLFGVSLDLVGALTLFPLPLAEIADQTVEATTLFHGQRFLWERIAEAQEFSARCHLVIDWLCHLYRPNPYLGLLQRACDLMRKEPTGNSVDVLTHELGVSSRHLRRIMLRQLGIGPAHYIRQSRFVDALHLMSTAHSLTEIAHAAHYADQAHFSRDFKEIAGMTPMAYRQSMGHVPGHLFL